MAFLGLILSMFPCLGSQNHRHRQKRTFSSRRREAWAYSWTREDGPDRYGHVRHHGPSRQ